jgi:hypothetical protein
MNFNETKIASMSCGGMKYFVRNHMENPNDSTERNHMENPDEYIEPSGGEGM